MDSRCSGCGDLTDSTDEFWPGSGTICCMCAASQPYIEITRLRAEVEELRGVLRDVEGVDTGNSRDYYVYRCPMCWVGSNGSEQYHDPDCRLAAALNDREEKS